MIKFREKVAYGLGDMSSSMFWKIFGMYMLYFYTDVFGLAPAVVGWMFLVTRIWDTAADPVIGVLSDRTLTRWGKFRPYILFGAVPFAVIGALTFIVPDFSDGGKLVYAYVVYSLMMLVYSLVNVPYASLLGVMSPDPKDRNQLSSYRMFFAYAGSFISLALVEPLVEIFTNIGPAPSPARGWVMTIAVIGTICATLFLLCFAGTRERVAQIEQKKNRVRDDVHDLLRNGPWWILLGAGVAALLFNSIRDGATIYYFKYYVLQTESVRIGGWLVTWSSLYLIVGQAANMVGVALSAPLSAKIGKKGVYIGAMAIATVLSAVFYSFTPDQMTLIFLFQILISMCAGSIFPLLWSMYADIADHSELRTGRRATGLIFSSSSMSQKLGWALGGAITGWLLGFYGFEANQVQGEGAIHGIRMMLSWLPAMGTALSVIFISLYPLGEKRVREVAAELERRRAAQNGQ
ncbi:MAG: MFS transporter [Rikenellaceae bacterium]|jgi:GPH family glycoside/pentoside/hexuronide:cation symporter|nr:MFS transporter [Rikenellaceae bacterium]